MDHHRICRFLTLFFCDPADILFQFLKALGLNKSKTKNQKDTQELQVANFDVALYTQKGENWSRGFASSEKSCSKIKYAIAA